MTFLELATEIDKEKTELAKANEAVNTAEMTLRSARSVWVEQDAKVKELMKEMQEMLGLSAPSIADTSMKELAKQGQQYRGTFKK